MSQTITDDEITLLAIKGAIAELPTEDAKTCALLIRDIKQLMTHAGAPMNSYAIALIAAELQMEAD